MAALPRPRWAVSIVSHGHGAGVVGALESISKQFAERPHEFILTLNAGEDPSFLDALPPLLRDRIRVRQNASPKGFAYNHNAALEGLDADLLLVADPDLTMHQPIASQLEELLAQDAIGIVAPHALTPEGTPEDNGRDVPTPWNQFVRNALGGRRTPPKYPASGPHPVDWIAGLFMAMRRETFAELNGFDARYHMYCEDVDLCLRAQLQRKQVVLLCGAHILHPANRNTFRRLRHLFWHVRSLIRLWLSQPYRLFRRKRANGII